MEAWRAVSLQYLDISYSRRLYHAQHALAIGLRRPRKSPWHRSRFLELVFRILGRLRLPGLLNSDVPETCLHHGKAVKL